jgi:Fe-S cluster assembly protein SufD
MSDPALDSFREAYQAVAAERSGTEPEWLLGARRAAMDALIERGLPTTRDENWRYTSVAAISRVRFERPNGGRQVPSVPLGGGGIRLTFVSGRFAPELSTLQSLPPGLEVRSLAAVLTEEPGRLEGGLATDGSAGAFDLLNAASFEDGAFIEVAAGTVVPKPVHLVFLGQGGGGPVASHTRSLVLSGRGSQLTLIELHAGPEGATYLSTSASRVVVEDGAVVRHYRVQAEGGSAFHVASSGATLGRDARLASVSVSLGAAISRYDATVVLDGEGADCSLDGLFLAGATQHMDVHTTVDHARPHGTSRELFKGILDGEAKGVFHGRVVVRKDAQQTDAQQKNQNLLLSRKAGVSSTPQLQILANDVRCKHASTTGHIDDDALFYLRSRGIAEDSARSLLTHAFASEIVGRIDAEPLRRDVDARLVSRLPGGVEVQEAFA